MQRLATIEASECFIGTLNIIVHMQGITKNASETYTLAADQIGPSCTHRIDILYMHPIPIGLVLSTHIVYALVRLVAVTSTTAISASLVSLVSQISSCSLCAV